MYIVLRADDTIKVVPPPLPPVPQTFSPFRRQRKGEKGYSGGRGGDGGEGEDLGVPPPPDPNTLHSFSYGVDWGFGGFGGGGT